MIMLLNQTWVLLTLHSKAHLLTPGVVKESEAFIAGAKQGVQAASA